MNNLPRFIDFKDKKDYGTLELNHGKILKSLFRKIQEELFVIEVERAKKEKQLEEDLKYNIPF